MIVAYRRLRGICCAGNVCFADKCTFGAALVELVKGVGWLNRENPTYFSNIGVCINGVEVGSASGVLLPDAPYPPLRTPGGWTRLIAWKSFAQASPCCVYSLWPDVYDLGCLGEKCLGYMPPPKLLTIAYRLDPAHLAGREWEKASVLPADRFPGRGKLTGEEFRIVEPDNDYLRLVGRGGDEYLAWDFVLGTLDSGEWVLFAEDGLYLARQEGGRVVVVGPYGGSVFDVRGPPYAPFYPVVPVKWIKERVVRALELARREVVHVDGEPYFYLPPLDPAYLLKWPLVLFKWEYRIVSHFAPFGGEVLLEDCEKVCQRVDPRPRECGGEPA